MEMPGFCRSMLAAQISGGPIIPISLKFPNATHSINPSP